MTQQVINLDTIFGGNSELLVVCYGETEYNSEDIDVLQFIVAVKRLIFAEDDIRNYTCFLSIIVAITLL